MKLIPKKSILLTGFTLLLGCFGCTDEGEPSSIENDNTQNEVYRRLQHCYDLFSENTTRGGEINILDTDTKYYTIIGDSVAEVEDLTRSIGNEFSITRISFEANNTQGFTILTEDPRIEKVYFFTDNGCIADTAQIGGLKWVIENIPLVAATELSQSESETQGIIDDPIFTGLGNDFFKVNIGPIVNTKWGQGYPYNIHTPYCKCTICDNEKYRRHKPIGCVAIATAQFIAKIGKFKGTYFGSRDLDFSNLPVDTISTSPMNGQRLGHFLHEIAVSCQTKFGCGESMSYLLCAYRYLKDLDYDCTYSEGALDITKFLSNLRNGYPHIMVGVEKGAYTGHAWLVDGYREDNLGYYFHTNWGWYGVDNGWVYGNPYSTNPSAYEPEKTPRIFSESLQHIYIN